MKQPAPAVTGPHESIELLSSDDDEEEEGGDADAGRVGESAVPAAGSRPLVLPLALRLQQAKAAAAAVDANDDATAEARSAGAAGGAIAELTQRSGSITARSHAAPGPGATAANAPVQVHGQCPPARLYSAPSSEFGPQAVLGGVGLKPQAADAGMCGGKYGSVDAERDADADTDMDKDACREGSRLEPAGLSRQPTQQRLPLPMDRQPSMQRPGSGGGGVGGAEDSVAGAGGSSQQMLPPRSGRTASGAGAGALPRPGASAGAQASCVDEDDVMDLTQDSPADKGKGRAPAAPKAAATVRHQCGGVAVGTMFARAGGSSGADAEDEDDADLAPPVLLSMRVKAHAVRKLYSGEPLQHQEAAASHQPPEQQQQPEHWAEPAAGAPSAPLQRAHSNTSSSSTSSGGRRGVAIASLFQAKPPDMAVPPAQGAGSSVHEALAVINRLAARMSDDADSSQQLSSQQAPKRASPKHGRQEDDGAGAAGTDSAIGSPGKRQQLQGGVGVPTGGDDAIDLTGDD